MRTLLMVGLLISLSLSAGAQVSSNGPVVKDYKQPSAGEPAEAIEVLKQAGTVIVSGASRNVVYGTFAVTVGLIIWI